MYLCYDLPEAGQDSRSSVPVMTRVRSVPRAIQENPREVTNEALI